MPLPLFSKNLDVKLLKLVKENPILYNTTHSNYLNFDAREVVWQKIGDALNRPAAQFAGIQCQVHFGDYQEDKHKPGFLENLSEYLPEQYSSSWGVEKKIFKAHKNHQGLSPLDAKHLYTKTARALPTYGVTFFLVKEKQKSKKKLVPRLLGINSESILRLDEVTKEILQVWPLTHVKTYHAGKSETFSLNFGDYSDKEYSVKTRDAYRIRDILESYIDLIRKKMLAKHHVLGSEGMIIGQDNVEASKGNIVQHVVNNPSKVVEQSFIGPSKLLNYEQGEVAGRGTQVMTLQQVMVSNQANQQHQAVKGEVPLRSDMSMDCMRKLNRLNSNSVKVVTLLTDPSDANIQDAQKIADSMNEDLAIVVGGVKTAAEKQSGEEAKKKMIEEVTELSNCMKILSDTLGGDHANLSEAEENAKRIADLSTQIYFSLDPRTKRRSDLLNRSRKSFKADEKKEASIRRASFIAAATTALHNVSEAQRVLSEDYKGPALDKQQLTNLKQSLKDKIGCLNAAVALYLTAHADPKNIDYTASVNSMITIKELMPQLAEDSQTLCSGLDTESRCRFLDDIRLLCDATRSVCTLTGVDDHAKMQEESSKYADISGKLIFTLGHGITNKENEIISLAKEVGDQTSLLLMSANEVSRGVESGAHAQELAALDAIGVRAAAAARDLLACAQLAAPSIDEPHCQSALTVAAEAMSSSAQHLTGAWKPLVEDPSRHHLGEQLRRQTLDLAKALDRLKDAYTNLDVPARTKGDESSTPREKQRLKFVNTISGAKKILQTAEDDFNRPTTTAAAAKGEEAENVRKRLAERLARLNAAVASLVDATSDRAHPDYVIAELAVNTLSELIPDLIKDAKAAGVDSEVGQEVRALCAAAADLCARAGAGAGDQDLNDSVAKYANASGKLFYVFSPKTNANKENEIMELAAGACGRTTQLLMNVQQLSQELGGNVAEELDSRGASTSDVAQALLSAAQVTAPSIGEARCQSALLKSVDALTASSGELARAWRELAPGAGGVKGAKGTKGAERVEALESELRLLHQQLDALRQACQHTVDDFDDSQHVHKSSPRDRQRLEFINTMAGARGNVDAAREELDKPLPPSASASAEAAERRLARLASQLAAAVAKLLAASADRDKPDYAEAELAMRTIGELVPDVIEDARTVGAGKEPATRDQMLLRVRQLCDATHALCAPEAKDLNDSAAKFADVTRKLVYVIGTKTDPKKEQQILDLSAGACGKASHMLMNVQQLSQQVDENTAAELDSLGANTSDAAQALLMAAQLTAPNISEPVCQSALLSSVNTLSSSAQRLSRAWGPLPLQGQGLALKDTLDREHEQLQRMLEEIRRSCRDTPQDTLRCALSSPAAAAIDKVDAAQRRVDEPMSKGVRADEAAESRLAQRVARLNAAVAALLAATNDGTKPDFGKAESALKTIGDLLPDIVEDTKAVSVDKDPATRDKMLDHVRQMCDATRALCSTDDKDLNNSVAKFADVSGKLVYVIGVNTNPKKEQQILDLSAAACGETSHLLMNVQKLSQQVGGDAAAKLDSDGANTSDAAQALLTAAQLTAPSISESGCQSALLSLVDALSSSAQLLSQIWRPLPLEAPALVLKGMLDKDLQQLESRLDEIRKACRDTPKDGTTMPIKPEIKQNPGIPTKRAPPPPPIRQKSNDGKGVANYVILATTVSPLRRKNSEVTQEFLDRLRYEESQDHVNLPRTQTTQVPPEQIPGLRKTDDEKRMYQQFVQSVDDADKDIRYAEEKLIQIHKVDSGTVVSPILSVNEISNKQRQIQEKLALASVEVASLVAANYADKIDFTAASKSTKALTPLISSIVEDGKSLKNSLNDKASNAFLDDMLRMCESTRKLGDTAKNNREKLNDAAIEFGDNSVKLLYAVSTDVDPPLAKEIITRAKAIGDSASRLALEAAQFAGGASGGGRGGGGGGGEEVRAVCDAGTRCVDAAGKLVYTAKLVSPTIHDSSCQNALVSSAENLSSHLKIFSNTWTPFSSDPYQTKSINQLVKEADNLEKLLEDLRKDIKGGEIGKRRELEKLVVEDTPLRQLSYKILEDAKESSECMDLPVATRRGYASYSKQLTDAINALDLANDRCRKAPHDTNKRRELEDAIQNLQMILLQHRPKREDKANSNIVDLRDFIQDVLEDAEKLIQRASETNVTRGTQALVELKEQCHHIQSEAFKLMNTENGGQVDTSFEDILQVDQFGQKCEGRMETVNQCLHGIDEQAKCKLQGRVRPLVESCNLLRFATKCALSTTQSASLDETLNDLDDLETRVIKSLVQDSTTTSPPASEIVKRNPLPAIPPKPWIKSKLSGAVANTASHADCQPLPGAVTAYVVDAATTANLEDPIEKDQLLKHLYKLVHILKCLTVTSSKRVASWQPVNHPEVATIAERVMQELEHPESGFGVKRPTQKFKVIDSNYANKLLVPDCNVRVVGDQRQLEDKLQEVSTKLNIISGSIPQSVSKPESLARTLHATTDTALQLVATARALKNKEDPVQSKKIEEAAQEMSYATYNLLKSSEHTSQDPSRPESRRNLLDALRQLNDSINSLTRITCPSPKLQQACGEVARSLQLAAGALQGAPRPACAAPYTQCVDAIHSQRDVIHKLKSDQAMSREEFLKNLNFITSAVCNSSEYAAQCAYLISISDENKEIAQKGLVDAPKLHKLIGHVQDSCMRIIRSTNIEDMQEEKPKLQKRLEDLSQALKEAGSKIIDPKLKVLLEQTHNEVNSTGNALCRALNERDSQSKIAPKTMELLSAVGRVGAAVDHPSLAPCPSPDLIRPDTHSRSEEVITKSKVLIAKTQALVKEVTSSPKDEPEMMTWVMFSSNRKQVLDVFDDLLNSVRTNGQRAGILEGSPEQAGDSETSNKSNVQIQLDLANKWLQKPSCKAETKAAGEVAVRGIIDTAQLMCEDMKGSEKEEMIQLILETEHLLDDCRKKYDHEKYSVLMERTRELKKAIERGVVTRVVEDFIEGGAPLADLDVLADAERDEAKRKFLLEKKIAELLAQLGRVTKTARFVADTGARNRRDSVELIESSKQAELLAPMLVKAAEERINKPNDNAVVENYKCLLAKYSESLSKVQDLCDRSVDPMDFVQTAGDTMQRMRDESTKHNDPQKCAYTSFAITKLANRVINVSMSSSSARSDPELQLALGEARARLAAATPAPHTRASRLPDWRDTTAEILRTTVEVESALGGENIFKKQRDEDQPIYSVALDLHAAVREWSSRDNEIVAVAKRMAVLMAKLSDYMNTDKKRELIATSKSIVSESHEVAYLAKKLAHECTDIRIKTNLLQACERIPTISGQLKMLTTVKGSSLGHQGTKEDKESMDMLVGNAQSLMLSIQDVLKAAASATVKIMSQHGPRLRWVRKNYY